jgi:hypothetical protein
MAEGRTDFDRDPNEWYVEPQASTLFLLDREIIAPRALIYDPACGMGNILRAAASRGHRVLGSDLVERPCSRSEPWWGGQADFLGKTRWPLGLMSGGVLLCNPPYGKAKTAEAFIRRAIRIPGLRMAGFFLNSKFLFGNGRARGLFTEHPPSRVWPVFPRPSCPPGPYLLAGNKAGGGIENFVWIVWDLGIGGGQSVIQWAPPEKAP